MVRLLSTQRPIFSAVCLNSSFCEMSSCMDQETGSTELSGTIATSRDTGIAHIGSKTGVGFHIQLALMMGLLLAKLLLCSLLSQGCTCTCLLVSLFRNNSYRQRRGTFVQLALAASERHFKVLTPGNA